MRLAQLAGHRGYELIFFGVPLSSVTSAQLLSGTWNHEGKEGPPRAGGGPPNKLTPTTSEELTMSPLTGPQPRRHARTA